MNKNIRRNNNSTLSVTAAMNSFSVGFKTIFLSGYIMGKYLSYLRNADFSVFGNRQEIISVGDHQQANLISLSS